MKRKQMVSGILIGALVSFNAQAQNDQSAVDDSQELDIIMTIVDEDDTPEAIFNRIELPPAIVSDVNRRQLSPTDIDPVAPVVENLVEDNLVEEAARTVTESLNDALSSGDIDNIPDDVLETIPDEVIEDLINDSTEDVDGIVDDVTTGTDDTLNNLEKSLTETERLIDDADTLSESAQRAAEDAEQAVDVDGLMEDGVKGL